MTEQRRGLDRKRYSHEQRAKAVGLSLTIGARAAGRQLGIPFGLVARWAKRPELAMIVVRSRQQVADSMWQAIADGTAQVATGLLDPKARLGEKAQALRVLIEAHALMTGGATQNIDLHANGITDGLSEDEKDQARELLMTLARANLDIDDAKLLRQSLDDRTDRDALDRVLADPLHISTADAMNAINAIEARLKELGDE